MINFEDSAELVTTTREILRSDDQAIVAATFGCNGLAPVATPQTKIILIVECWEFVRGCLVYWLRDACPEYEVVSGSDLEHSVGESAVDRIGAVVVRGETLQRTGKRFEEDIAWLQQRRPDVPVIAIVPVDLLSEAECWVSRFGLSGYIPVFSTTDVASAALRLVIAGGHYFPRTYAPAGGAPPGLVATEPAPPQKDVIAKLTLRERAVLEHLSRGNPNKIIAHELNMSVSTVKAHVHSIIQKWSVKNRTEAAVAARSIQFEISSQS